MKKLVISLIAITITFNYGYSQSDNDFSEKNSKIDSIMNSNLVHSGKHPVHNFMLYAKNKKSGFEINKGVGIIGRNENPINENFQFRIASITKTFVATVMLQLVEEGKLKLDDYAYTYLKDIDFLVFDEFLLKDGVSISNQIKVEDLLRHTSGVGDIFTDKETRFVLSVLLHKKRLYNEEKVIKLYFKYNLHKQPYNIPGEGYHYSDINYMLCGFIIEQITSKTLAQNIRERILDPLKLTNTYFEYYEPATGINQQIDAYLNKLNLTKKVNTSYEWAGGGLVSTVKELGVFIDALFSLRLFQKEETLAKMIDLKPAQVFKKDAGMGIFKYTVNGETYFGHGGYYGSLLLYSPQDEIVFSVNIGQANAALDPQELVNSLIEVVKK